jgi:hypothetical protein
MAASMSAAVNFHVHSIVVGIEFVPSASKHERAKSDGGL